MRKKKYQTKMDMKKSVRINFVENRGILESDGEDYSFVEKKI